MSGSSSNKCSLCTMHKNWLIILFILPIDKT
nr:MAG TPA: hypothetical protein [Caudoviricetes sp.]